MSEDGRGYLVPTPAQPYDSICIKVYVPNERLYIAAFWGAYQFFTTWLAWARDPLKRGKQAAALWKTAYDKARAEFEIRKGSCDMAVTDIRLNPNNKCDLQVRYDGGEWTSVADLSDCQGCGGGSGGALQFDGLNITQYNSCNNTFEPIGEPYNPITSNIYDSLYDDDEDGACNGAANIAAWLHHVGNVGLQINSTTTNLGAVASEILGIIVGLSGIGLVFNTLLTALVGLFAAEGSEWDDAIGTDIQSDMQNALYPFMSSDGTIREPDWSAALDNMQDIHDALALLSAERTRWGFELMVLRTLGPSIVSRQNKYAGITDADCSSAGWTHVFDLTSNNGGFVQNVDGSGVYVSGQGWRTQLKTDEFGNYYTVVQIKRAMPSRTLTSAKIYFTQTLGENHQESEFEAIGAYLYANDLGNALINQEEHPNGSQVATWVGSEAAVSLIIPALVVGFWAEEPEADPGGLGTITKIILSGEGTDPF